MSIHTLHFRSETRSRGGEGRCRKERKERGGVDRWMGVHVYLIMSNHGGHYIMMCTFYVDGERSGDLMDVTRRDLE